MYSEMDVAGRPNGRVEEEKWGEMWHVKNECVFLVGGSVAKSRKRILSVENDDGNSSGADTEEETTPAMKRNPSVAEDKHSFKFSIMLTHLSFYSGELDNDSAVAAEVLRAFYKPDR